MPSTSHTTIKHFLVKDGQRVKGSFQRSILLEIERELWYNIGETSKAVKYKDIFTGYESTLRTPRLVPVLLFVSAIDVIARAENMRIPGKNEISVFFKNCCQQYFSISKENAEKLWAIRTSLVHQYKLPNGTMVSQLGPVNEVLSYDNKNNDMWLFPYYMPRLLGDVIKNLANQWFAESSDLKNKRAKYLDEFGFFYDNNLFNFSWNKVK